ncbi:hypothetical protein RJ639_029197 [Escallonia herrerae]|uniref:REF/SRPP-like protein n=1 Tax=Escallonia herrerae TaxID=1293975 RepID=A0AA88XCJ5_9ASTE|nr:hypothetical protein RJ639_029197 [Escallonia herrerae]
MASDKVEIEKSDEKLKHLGFVRMIAMNAVVCVSHLYECAKQNSGPLKSTVGHVESAVTNVVGPVYDKFKGLPGDVLVFLDNKVDEATIKFDEHAPPLAKQVVGQAQSMVKKASQVAQDLVQEFLVGGPHAAIHHAGSLYKQSVLSQSAKMWYVVNKIPPCHTVAQIVVPTAAHLSEKYNKVIAELAAKGYSVFNHFPLVPLDEIAKAYKQVEAAHGDASCDEREAEIN